MNVWVVQEAESDDLNVSLFETLELAEAFVRAGPGEWGPLTCACDADRCSGSCDDSSFHIDCRVLTGIETVEGGVRVRTYETRTVYLTRTPVATRVLATA